MDPLGNFNCPAPPTPIIRSTLASLAASINGTQTSTIAFAGGDPTSVTKNENYNGTTWAEINDMNTLRGSLSGAGTATSALAIAGYEPNFRDIVESWNGAVWTVNSFFEPMESLKMRYPAMFERQIEIGQQVKDLFVQVDTDSFGGI